MITLTQCARLTGLNSKKLLVGVAPTARHHHLLQSHYLDLHYGRAAVRNMIVGDLIGFLDIGAHRCPADRPVVLGLFLVEPPQTSDIRPQKMAA